MRGIAFGPSPSLPSLHWFKLRQRFTVCSVLRGCAKQAVIHFFAMKHFCYITFKCIHELNMINCGLEDYLWSSANKMYTTEIGRISEERSRHGIETTMWLKNTCDCDEVLRFYAESLRFYAESLRKYAYEQHEDIPRNFSRYFFAKTFASLKEIGNEKNAKTSTCELYSP